MTFRWRADGCPTLNGGFVACGFTGIRTSIARKPYFCDFSGGLDPLSHSGSAHVSCHYVRHKLTLTFLLFQLEASISKVLNIKTILPVIVVVIFRQYNRTEHSFKKKLKGYVSQWQFSCHQLCCKITLFLQCTLQRGNTKALISVCIFHMQCSQGYSWRSQLMGSTRENLSSGV